jgi:Fic family protein
MDATRFTKSKTGELVRIATPEGPDWAFLPNPLPPAWEFPARLWPLLGEAIEQLARLDEKGRTMANPTLLITPLQKREALRSSSLEGTYASAKELLLYELNPREPVSKDDRANDWREVYNYDRSLRYGFTKLVDGSPQGLPLSSRLIKDMHRLLLGDVRQNAKDAGEFRKRQVHVGSDRRYVPPPPGEKLDAALRDFEGYLNEHGDQYHPLVLSYLVHYQFEAIHPFLDGNGRIGRALLSLTTLHWGRLYMPWLYMSAYFERYKDEYIDNLFRVSTHGDWDRWIEFCLRGTADQCRDAIRRCDKLNSIRNAMRAEVGHLPRMYNIIEKMFFTPAFQVSDVMAWGQSSRPTARADIDVLMKKNFVSHLMGQRPRTYFAPEIFEAAYSEKSDEIQPESIAAPVSASST